MRAPEPVRVPADRLPGEVKMVEPGSSAAMRSKEIRTVLKQADERSRPCYEDKLKKDPTLEGQVITTLVIDIDGKVTVKSMRGDVADGAIKKCIKDVFNALEFGKGEVVTHVTYPILVAPSRPQATASAEPTAAPSSSAAPPPPPLEDSPIVAIEGTKVTLDGRPIADVDVIASQAKPWKVAAVVDALGAWQDAWRKKNPDPIFIGVAGLRVDPKASALVVKSVLHSMAIARFEDILVQSAAEPASIHEVAAELGPLAPEDGVLLGEVPRVLSARLSGAEVTLTWRKDSAVVSEESVKSTDLPSKVCESWKKHGQHVDPAGPYADKVTIFVADTVVYADIEGALKAFDSCSKPGLDASTRPAFWKQIAVR